MSVRVAVVGSSGFLGSHIVAALERRGHGIVRMHAPRLSSPLHDVEALTRFTGSQLPEQDRLPPVDVVVNAAGVPTATRRASDAMVTANAALPQLLLRMCVRDHVPRFIHVSSSAVQGTRDPLDDTLRWAPESAYGETKALGERLLLKLLPSVTDTSLVIYRPPGVHAPERAVTRSLAALARSAWAMTAEPGDANTPQALADNVADAIRFLCTATAPPVIVHHPGEGVTTSALLAELGGHQPKLIPRSVVDTALRVGDLLGGRAGPLRPHLARARLLLVGQEQLPSWLTTAGWQPPSGQEVWKDVGRMAGRFT